MKPKTTVEARESDFFVYAMRRSGHHAIINWLQKHYAEVDYYSNVLWDGVELMSLRGDRYQYQNPLGEGCCRILSFEDQKEADAIPKMLKQYPVFPCQKRFLILRDPYNCYASRLHRARNRPLHWGNWPSCLDGNIWKSFAREFLGETKVLGDFIPVNYNRWSADESYRRELALSLTGRFDDSGRAEVATIGKGSSFDDFAYQNKADEMSVLSRWRAYANDAEYQHILGDPEIRDLCSRIPYFNVLEPQL